MHQITSDIAFTPAVKAIQSRRGSRASYEKAAATRPQVRDARCVPSPMQTVGAADARMTCPHVVASLAAVTPPAADPQEQPNSATDAPRVLPCSCPCCGARMIVIEVFARGCQPKWRPTPNRIDTS